MSQDFKNLSKLPSSDLQSSPESGHDEKPSEVHNLPVQPFFLNRLTLTRSKVVALQRTIGNQATQRIILRELASRKPKSLIQRDPVTTAESGVIKKGAASAKSFWTHKEQAKTLTGNSYTKGVSTLDFAKVKLADFKQKRTLQEIVFDLAQKTVDNQKSKAEAILSSKDVKGAEVSALKKRSTFEAFVTGVIDKCEQKPYETLSEMDDIARGRVNVKSEEDMNKVAAGLTPGAKDITAPRKTSEGITKYPRWHVITYDPTGMTFEWQIGTHATTTLYEIKRIVFPPALKTAAEKQGKHVPEKADIHDLEYAVFQRMISSKNPDTAAAAQEYKVPAFVKKVALASQKSGKLGESNPEFMGEINALLDEASDLLRQLVEGGKTDLLVPLLH